MISDGDPDSASLRPCLTNAKRFSSTTKTRRSRSSKSSAARVRHQWSGSALGLATASRRDRSAERRP